MIMLLSIFIIGCTQEIETEEQAVELSNKMTEAARWVSSLTANLPSYLNEIDLIENMAKRHLDIEDSSIDETLEKITESLLKQNIPINGV